VALAYQNSHSNQGALVDRLSPTVMSTDGGGLGGLAEALTGIPAPLVNGVAGAIGDVVNTGNIGGSVTYQVGSTQVSSSASYNLYSGTLHLGNSWLNTPQLQPWQPGYEQWMSGNDPQVADSAPLYLNAANNASPTLADTLPPIQLDSVATSMVIDDPGLGGLSSLGVPSITDVAGGTLDSFLKNAESFVDAGRQGMVSFGYSHGGQLGGAISQSVADMLGFDEGVVVAGAKTISGTLQLLTNVAEVTSPLEWARDPSGNLNRLQTAYGAFNALDSVIDPVQVVLNPQLALANGTAILKGATQDFRDDLAGRDYSKFAGRLTGTLGSLWVGGEAGGVAKVGRAAEVVKASQEAEILEGVEGGVPSTVGPVKALDVGSYQSLRARAVVGDNLEHDHIPSFAALRTAAEIDNGGPLTEAELQELYNNATAVEVPRDVHMEGPTYGGKNTPTQIKADAADIPSAIQRDTEALRANLISRGYDPSTVDQTIQQIYLRNRQMGIIQ
jgi:hypothetical protein